MNRHDRRRAGLSSANTEAANLGGPYVLSWQPPQSAVPWFVTYAAIIAEYPVWRLSDNPAEALRWPKERAEILAGFMRRQDMPGAKAILAPVAS